MLIGGNMSTGICTRAVSPTTQTSKQSTMMKYGCRMENVGMFLLHPRSRNDLWCYDLSALELVLLAENHRIAFVQARKHFRIRGRHDTQLDFTFFHASGSVD